MSEGLGSTALESREKVGSAETARTLCLCPRLAIMTGAARLTLSPPLRVLNGASDMLVVMADKRAGVASREALVVFMILIACAASV